MNILGHILDLLLMSRLHRRMALEDLARTVVPPMHLGQCEVFCDPAGKPVGFVTWAFVTDELLSKLKSNQHRIQPHEWKCGDKLWFNDFVAPFGHCRQMVRRLRHRFGPTFGSAIRRYADGSTRASQYRGEFQ